MDEKPHFIYKGVGEDAVRIKKVSTWIKACRFIIKKWGGKKGEGVTVTSRTPKKKDKYQIFVIWGPKPGKKTKVTQVGEIRVKL